MSETLKIEIIRSRRKSVAIEVRPDGRVLVRAPYYVPVSEIRAFLTEKEDWIRQSLEKQRALQKQRAAAAPVQKLTREELSRLADAAMQDLPARVARFAPLVGVTYGRITIRNQRSRWGSCSSQGNLNFNCLLMLAPEGARDYVVVHELCHRKEMNHSPAFWAEVRRVMPDCETWKKWFRNHGTEIMRRMTG